jgi:hypothetical protein
VAQELAAKQKAVAKADKAESDTPSLSSSNPVSALEKEGLKALI